MPFDANFKPKYQNVFVPVLNCSNFYVEVLLLIFISCLYHYNYNDIILELEYFHY